LKGEARLLLSGINQAKLERKMKIINTAILLLLFSINAMAVDSHPAEKVVQATTEQVLAVLKQQNDSGQVNQMINDIILPNFNFQQMSKWALGKQGSKLDEMKQTLFVSHFQQLLVNTYTTALTKFDNQSIDVLKAKSGKNKKVVMVPTQITLANAKPMKISYMMMDSEDGWKVVDMSISGVSLIRNYRSTYANEIRSAGFDALMDKIIKKNELAGL
jgi:phospholipid transport system substrate-binding protein